VPTPVRLGEPTQSYPWRWSVVPWFVGVAADLQEPHPNQAKRFAFFLRSLHITAPSHAPQNSVRGVPLHHRAAVVEARMQRLEQTTNLITSEIKQIWNQALHTPMDVPAQWLHGDLHPRNILVENGAIAAIIDWGDITSGDVATDLAAFWMLFSDSNTRQQAIAEYRDLSEATQHRSKGWAILFAVTLLDTGLVDNPRNAMLGERILQNIREAECST
jgi:aminoglycoside phosphotransferase (APT) family kinase protein